MSLLLPLNGVALAVDPSQQPLDDLLRVLRAEKAPIGAWLAAAHGLLACGREADYEALLSEAVERETQPGGPEVFANVQALCSLAEFTLQQAAAERDRRQRTVLLSRSTELCHRAQRLSLVTGAEEQLPELVLGHAALVRVRHGRLGGCWRGWVRWHCWPTLWDGVQSVRPRAPHGPAQQAVPDPAH